jgi:hypothetical protein
MVNCTLPEWYRSRCHRDVIFGAKLDQLGTMRILEQQTDECTSCRRFYSFDHAKQPCIRTRTNETDFRCSRRMSQWNVVMTENNAGKFLIQHLTITLKSFPAEIDYHGKCDHGTASAQQTASLSASTYRETWHTHRACSSSISLRRLLIIRVFTHRLFVVQTRSIVSRR